MCYFCGDYCCCCCCCYGYRRSSCQSESSDSSQSVDDPVAMETGSVASQRSSSRESLGVLPPIQESEDAGVEDEDVEEDAEPAPQIKIGADGSIVIDETSLVSTFIRRGQ